MLSPPRKGIIARRDIKTRPQAMQGYNYGQMYPSAISPGAMLLYPLPTQGLADADRGIDLAIESRWIMGR